MSPHVHMLDGTIGAFVMRLPKKLKNWQILNNEFYFEYDNREIIYISSGFKNIGNAQTWRIRETNEDEIYATLNTYWNQRGYNENSLTISRHGRVSKVYSDGKVSILLYNIKKENFEKYYELVKIFKYI